MGLKLALVSTGIGVVAPITVIIKEKRPEIEIVNIVDDGIVKSIAANGNIIPPAVKKRLTFYMMAAEEQGANAALLTCSSVSEVVDLAKNYVRIPVYKIDEPMAEEAVSKGKRIGIVATLATTLEPTKRLIRAKALQANKDIIIHDALCNNAFEALQSGNPARHDELVKEAISGLVTICDVVVLAQATMARVLESMGQLQCPVLSSPRSGVERVLKILK